MAHFVGEIHKLQVETHPKADRLEIAGVMDYTCVVRRADSFEGIRSRVHFEPDG